MSRRLWVSDSEPGRKPRKRLAPMRSMRCSCRPDAAGHAAGCGGEVGCGPVDGGRDLPDRQAGRGGRVDGGGAGRSGKSAEQVELEAARAEIERLSATVTEQAVTLHLQQGKSSWD